MSVGLEHFLVVGAILFGIGLLLSLSKRNIIGVLMGIELMFNGANVTLVAFSRFLEAAEALAGQVLVVFSITVAAAEAAVALALAMAFYRRRQTVDVDRADVLRW
ncbi:MAG: NADH-quinone oxidoreductase subunit NuoK [Dehalococcoidia bacterium]|jgi:NADH:ubiquinone oxidoreductase subunit K|nr:NADH-quinone oxidoreductase subunit NuoK [Dehalococcoidia bacterium]